MTMMMVLTISIQVYEWKMRSIKGIARGRRVSVRRRTEIVNEILKKISCFFAELADIPPCVSVGNNIAG